MLLSFWTLKCLCPCVIVSKSVIFANIISKRYEIFGVFCISRLTIMLFYAKLITGEIKIQPNERMIDDETNQKNTSFAAQFERDDCIHARS